MQEKAARETRVVQLEERKREMGTAKSVEGEVEAQIFTTGSKQDKSEGG
jgi:hypothetical protein